MFCADCSLIVEKVKLGVQSSLGKAESELVCSSRCSKCGAISHLISYIFKPSHKFDAQYRIFFSFFFLLNVLTLGSFFFFESSLLECTAALEQGQETQFGVPVQTFPYSMLNMVAVLLKVYTRREALIS